MNITNEYNYQLSVQQVLAKNIINLPKAKKNRQSLFAFYLISADLTSIWRIFWQQNFEFDIFTKTCWTPKKIRDLLISICFATIDLTSNDLGEDLKAKGSLYLRNRDKDGKQLLIFDVKKHVKGVVPMEEMQKVFLYFLERIDRESEDGMVTIVFDCQGCGLKNMDMEFIRYMIDVLKDYFPQVLNYILVLDMPWVLNGNLFQWHFLVAA